VQTELSALPVTDPMRGLRLPSRAVMLSVLLALGLQWVIAAVYATLIVDLFGGARASHAGGGLEIAVAYVMTALATLAVALYCERRTSPSRVIVLVHLLAVIIPLQALVAAQFEFARPEFADTVAGAFIGAVVFAGVMPDVRVPPAGRLARSALGILAILLTCYVYAALLSHGGLGRLSFDLSTVYQVREEFIEDAAPFVGYFVPWQGYVLNPLLMLLGLRRRAPLVGGLGLALQLLLFGMTGYRAFLLIPLLVLGVYLFARRRQLLLLALAAVLGVIAAALLLYAWLDQPIIPALLVDRVIVIPAEIHYWYYDFFGVGAQPTLQLSQSLLAALSVSHYTTPIPEVIGWKYMGSAASANVGLFGDAFANFGFAGCFIFALLFALLLKAVDAAGRRADTRVAVALVAMPAFQLVNSGLLTTLLTHGLALTIIVLWTLPAPASQASGQEPR
jgi:hypothetical protein